MIGRFSAEHEAIVNGTGVLRRTAGVGDLTAMQTAVHVLAELLDPHALSEKRSLFAELRADPEFTDHVDPLCGEHREINVQPTIVAEGNLTAVIVLETLLGHHIDKEEHDLFLATVVALDGPAGERVARA